MEDARERQTTVAPLGKARRIVRISWLLVLFVGDWLIDAGEANWHIIRREADLFLGTLFTILGVFGFHSGKYCDGNTADYLSCTRPTTFYYYGWLEITLILIGTFFIILWFLKRRTK